MLVFSWLAYMRVQNLCYGFAQWQRFSLYVAVAMFVGHVVFDRGRWFLRDRRNSMMIVLGILVSASLVFTRYGIDEVDVDYLLEFLKILAVAMFTTCVVNSWERLRAICWVIAVSLCFYGFKSGVFGVLAGGGSLGVRGAGGAVGAGEACALGHTMR